MLNGQKAILESQPFGMSDDTTSINPHPTEIVIEAFESDVSKRCFLLRPIAILIDWFYQIACFVGGILMSFINLGFGIPVIHHFETHYRDNGRNQAAGTSKELGPKKNREKNMGSGLCSRCTNKNGVLEADQVINDLLKEQKKLKLDNEKLETRVHGLEKELENYKKRDGELTQQMALNLMSKSNGVYEAIPDVSSPGSIKKTLEILNNDTWCDVMGSVFSEDERTGLSYLCRIIHDCYKFCEETARAQLDTLLYPKPFLKSQQWGPDLGSKEETTGILIDGEEEQQQHIEIDQILEEREITELFRIRRISAASSKTQSCMRKLFRREVALDTETLELFAKVPEAAKNLLQQYWDSCVRICWLMVISDPPLKLKFCEENIFYDGKVKDMFQAYSIQEVIRLENKPKNTVFSTVLPAMVSCDEKVIYLRGKVIITSQDGWNDIED